MTRRCFLHVGSPKTGTTFLQNVVWANREELAGQGLHLPLERIDHFSLTLLLRDRVDPEVDGEEVSSVLDRLVAEVAATEEDVLVSHELLASADPERIATLLERLTDREVHVIVTARDWRRQLPAGWQQSVKTRNEADFADFVERARNGPDHPFRRNQDFAAIAGRWGASLPPEQVHVVTVPPAGTDPGELLQRYCRVLGIDPAALVTEGVGRSNPSLSHAQTELVRRINMALGDDRLPKPRLGYNRAVKFWFAEQVLGPIPGDAIAVPASDHDWLRSEGREQARAIEAAGFDVVGDLADLIPVQPTGPGDAQDPADTQRLLELAVEGLAATLTQRAEDLLTMERQRKRVRRLRRRAQQAEREVETLRAGPEAPSAPPPSFAERLRGRLRRP